MSRLNLETSLLSIDTEDLLIEEFHQAGIYTERELLDQVDRRQAYIAERNASFAKSAWALGPPLEHSYGQTSGCPVCGRYHGMIS